MSINLSRNTKVYFTTNVNQSTGILSDATTGISPSNTFEIGVDAGYTFSQATTQQTINVSEAGSVPTRGQRAFNQSLDAAAFTFTTYIRPTLAANVVAPQERVLWAALLTQATGATSATPLDATGVTVTTITRASTATSIASIVSATQITQTVNGTSAPVTTGDILLISGATNSTEWNNAVKLTAAATGAGPYTYAVEYATAPNTAATTAALGALKAYCGGWAPSNTTAGSFSYTSTMGSNRNQLIKFAMIFVVDQVVYAIDNCVMDTATIDFGIQNIAQIAWSGKGTVLKVLSTLNGTFLNNGANATLNPTSAAVNYITNKLSTMTLQSNISGSDYTTTAAVSYVVAITGGQLTISNNVTYLVPTNLGVVNTAIGYFTGNRSITGNVTAYLKTGSTDPNGTGQLLQDLLAGSATTTEPKFRLQLEMGGSSNATRVEFEMPGTVLQIPTVNIADVVAATINFTAEGYNPDVQTQQIFDLAKTNELQVRYFSS